MENSSDEIPPAAIPCPVLLKMQNSARAVQSVKAEDRTKVSARRKFESAGLFARRNEIEGREAKREGRVQCFWYRHAVARVSYTAEFGSPRREDRGRHLAIEGAVRWNQALAA